MPPQWARRCVLNNLLHSHRVRNFFGAVLVSADFSTVIGQLMHRNKRCARLRCRSDIESVEENWNGFFTQGANCGSMIEMKMNAGCPILDFGAHAIGVAAQHIAGEAAKPGLGINDLSFRWTPIRKFERIAAIKNFDTHTEFIEPRGDGYVLPGFTMIANSIDRLADPENGSADDILSRTPSLPGAEKEVINFLRDLGLLGRNRQHGPLVLPDQE